MNTNSDFGKDGFGGKVAPPPYQEENNDRVIDITKLSGDVYGPYSGTGLDQPDGFHAYPPPKFGNPTPNGTRK